MIGLKVFMAMFVRLIFNRWQAARHNDRNEITSMAMIVMVSREMIILRVIPLGRRTNQ